MGGTTRGDPEAALEELRLRLLDQRKTSEPPADVPDPDCDHWFASYQGPW